MYTVEKTKALIAKLAHSQGSYGRMYDNLEETDRWEELTEVINENDCKDDIDVVMLIEG